MAFKAKNYCQTAAMLGGSALQVVVLSTRGSVPEEERLPGQEAHHAMVKGATDCSQFHPFKSGGKLMRGASINKQMDSRCCHSRLAVPTQD